MVIFLPQNRFIDVTQGHNFEQYVCAAAGQYHQRTPQIGDHIITETNPLFLRSSMRRIELIYIVDDFWQMHINVQ